MRCITSRLHNLRQPNTGICAFAPITRETTADAPDTTLCGVEATSAWDHTDGAVCCLACIEAIDAEHALALVSTLVTSRSSIRPQFLREGDLIESDGSVYRVDDEPCVDEDGMVVIPVDVFGWAHCVEIPATGWATLVMQELMPADLDDTELAGAA